MKNLVKYLAFIPLLLIQYSCDDTSTDATVNNGDVVGSWMLTGLTGTYVYTVAQPGSDSGVTWPADSTYGIKVRWNYASYLPDAYKTSTDAWIAEVEKDSVALYTNAVYDLATMKAAGFGLIGVFEDAPALGEDATYKMKGEYPGIFYNYSQCASGGSTAPMTDQGLYTWNPTATSNNFVIKRDPSIAGSQVLPPFDDGDITVMTDSSGNSTLNIKFLDRDSHSALYAQVMDAWDEGMHPDTSYGGNGINSGGDRTYMAFPPMVLDEDGAFVAAYDGSPGTLPATEGYYKSPMFAYWGGYMTYYAFVYNAESGLLKSGMVSGVDSDSDGTITDTEVVTYMVSNPTNTLSSDPTIKYSDLVTLDSTTGAPKFTDDSASDYSPTNGSAGGKMTFDVISDCAVPVDVTIQFDATFARCTTDNCVGDDYHVSPTWD